MPKIKDLPKIDRPREKLAKYGPEKLSNSELLAILLRTGTKEYNVIELSKRILSKFGSKKLPEVSYAELKKVFGLGSAKACEIVACFELGKRLLKSKKANLYLSSQDVWQELKDIRGKKKEHFVVLYLNTRNQEIEKEIISVGSLNANLVHPREVFEPAVQNLAAQIIIAHNHPSGDPEPSKDDLEITKRLVKAGKILGIEIIDHIIVTKNDFFSFKDKKLI
ncbi:DNA repair protein RadC [Patescibacteria group bacterium AH-259-L07]|nr:DNA repair protein RadC [Patescibacteria group bacterium AH-259-L07]